MPTDIHPRVRAELADRYPPPIPRLRAELDAMGCTPEVAAVLIEPRPWPPRGKDDAFVRMRDELAWRLRQPDPRTGIVLSYPEIAWLMNRPTHSTVVYMVRRHEERAKSAVTGGESEAAA